MTTAPRVFSLLLHAISPFLSLFKESSPLLPLSLFLSLPFFLPPVLSGSDLFLPLTHPVKSLAERDPRLQMPRKAQSVADCAPVHLVLVPFFPHRYAKSVTIVPCISRPRFRLSIEDASMGRPVIEARSTIGQRSTGDYHLRRTTMLAILSFTMLAVIAVANPFLDAAQGNSFICRFMSLRQFYDCRAIKKLDARAREKDQRGEEKKKKKRRRGGGFFFRGR